VYDAIVIFEVDDGCADANGRGFASDAGNGFGLAFICREFTIVGEDTPVAKDVVRSTIVNQ